MKMFLTALTLVLALPAFAQSVNVKDVSTNEEGTTTIEIKKGKNAETKNEAIWEVTEGTSDIEGEAGATNKDAKAAWTKACGDWKKEVRADNKENKILVLNCGTSTCGGDAGSKTCTSKATYKLKTKMN